MLTLRLTFVTNESRQSVRKATKMVVADPVASKESRSGKEWPS